MLDSQLFVATDELLTGIRIVLLTVLVLLERLAGLSLLAEPAGPIVFGLIGATSPESTWWLCIGSLEWP